MLEDEWEKIDHENSFHFYCGVGDVILILEKMIKRFKTEAKQNDLQIIKDSLTVIPIINEIIQIAEQYKTDDNLAEQISEIIDELDEFADKANLLKTHEEYLENVDKNTIKKLFDGMLEIMEIPKKSPYLFT